MEIAKFLQSAVAWAENESGIVAIALVGSHARSEARLDSDVDLMVLAPDPSAYLENPTWLELFGVVASRETEDWGAVTSLRAFYEGGLEVEFGLSTPAWADIPVDAGTRRVVSDGIRVLYDPGGILSALQQNVEA